MTRYMVRYAAWFARTRWWFRQVLLAAFVAAVIAGHFYAASRRMDAAVAVQDRVWFSLSADAVAYARAQR